MKTPILILAFSLLLLTCTNPDHISRNEKLLTEYLEDCNQNIVTMQNKMNAFNRVEAGYQDSISKLKLQVQELITALNQDKEPYLYNLPPSPPYFPTESTIVYDPSEGCDYDPKPHIGYIIEILENDEVLIQNENGARTKYQIWANNASNANRSWLPYILIPGNKVEMEIMHCGSGGFQVVMKIKTLPRKY